MEGGVVQELDIAYKRDCDHFFEKLQEFHKARGTPIERIPTFGGQTLDLYALYNTVISFGGVSVVTEKKKWGQVFRALGFPPCTNAAYALKQHYNRYLEHYERIFFLGEDTEDTTATRTYAQMLKYRRLNKSPKLGPLGEPLVDNFNRISFSLQSGLQNEVDFALNICSLLSNVPNSIFNLAKCPSILDLMLGHVGIWSRDENHIKQLYDEWYSRPDTKDFVKFWRCSLENQIVREIYEEDNLDCALLEEKYKMDEKNTKLLVNEEDYMETNSPECCRINQVCIILYNFSFETMNALHLATHPSAIRFLLMASCCTRKNVQRSGLDALDNIANNLTLQGLESTFTQRFLEILNKFLHSNDKFRRCRAMSILSKLASKEGNKLVLTETLCPDTYRVLIETLYLPDIALILASLDTLYSFTSLDEVVATGIAKIHGSIDVLVCLVTVRAETYGNKAIKGYRIIENKLSMFTPKNQQWIKEQEEKRLQQHRSPPGSHKNYAQRQIHRQQPPPPGVYPQHPNMMNNSFPPTHPLNRHPYPMHGPLHGMNPNQPHGMNPNFPMNNPQMNQYQEEMIEIEPATYAANWMSGYYEPHPTNMLYTSAIHEDYVNTCKEVGRQGVLELGEFIKVLRSIIPPHLAQILPPSSDGKVGISGICRRKQTMPVQNRLPRHILERQSMRANGPPNSMNNMMPPSPRMPPHSQMQQQIPYSQMQMPRSPMPPPQIQPRQMPPSQIPPFQMPPSQMPPSQMPPSQMPPSQMPSLQMPPLQMPPSQMPPSSQMSPSQTLSSQIMPQMSLQIPLQKMSPDASTEASVEQVLSQMPPKGSPKMQTPGPSQIPHSLPPQLTSQVPPGTSAMVSPQMPPQLPPHMPPQFPPQLNPQIPPLVSSQMLPVSSQMLPNVSLPMHRQVPSRMISQEPPQILPPQLPSKQMIPSQIPQLLMRPPQLRPSPNINGIQLSNTDTLHAVENIQPEKPVSTPDESDANYAKPENATVDVGKANTSVSGEGAPEQKSSNSEAKKLEMPGDNASTIALGFSKNLLSGENLSSAAECQEVIEKLKTEMQAHFMQFHMHRQHIQTIQMQIQQLMQQTQADNLPRNVIKNIQMRVQAHHIQMQSHYQRLQQLNAMSEQVQSQLQLKKMKTSANCTTPTKTNSDSMKILSTPDITNIPLNSILPGALDTSLVQSQPETPPMHPSIASGNNIEAKPLVHNAISVLPNMQMNHSVTTSKPILSPTTVNMSSKIDGMSPTLSSSVKQPMGQQFIVPPPFPYMQNNMVSIQHGIPNGSFVQSPGMMSPPHSPVINKGGKGSKGATRVSTSGTFSPGQGVSPGGRKSKTGKTSRRGSKKGNISADEKSAFSKVTPGSMMNGLVSMPMDRQLCSPFETATGTMPRFPQGTNIPQPNAPAIGQPFINTGILRNPFSHPLSPEMIPGYPPNSYNGRFPLNRPPVNAVAGKIGNNNLAVSASNKEILNVESANSFSSFNGTTPHKDISNGVKSTMLNSQQTQGTTNTYRNMNGSISPRVPEDSSLEVKKLRDLTEQLESTAKKKKIELELLPSAKTPMEESPNKSADSTINFINRNDITVARVDIQSQKLSSNCSPVAMENHQAGSPNMNLNTSVTVEKQSSKGNGSISPTSYTNNNNINNNNNNNNNETYTNGTVINFTRNSDEKVSSNETPTSTATTENNSSICTDEKPPANMRCPDDDIDFVMHAERNHSDNDKGETLKVNGHSAVSNVNVPLNRNNNLKLDLHNSNHDLIGANKTIVSLNSSTTNNILKSPVPSVISTSNLKNKHPENIVTLTQSAKDDCVGFHSCKWTSCNLPPFRNVTGLLAHMIQIHGPLEGQLAVCKVPGCSNIKKPRRVMISHFQEKHCLKRNKDGIMSSVPLPKITIPKENEWKFEEESPVTRSVRYTAALILRNIARCSSYGKRLILRYEDRLSLVSISTSEAAPGAAECLLELSKCPKDMKEMPEEMAMDPEDMNDISEDTKGVSEDMNCIFDDLEEDPEDIDCISENLDDTLDDMDGITEDMDSIPKENDCSIDDDEQDS